MGDGRHARGTMAACGVAMLVAVAPAVRAQSIEPRAYSNAPVGVNFLIAGYAYTRGGVAFDPSLPLDDPQLSVSGMVLAYARVLDIAGMSAKIDAVLPYAWLDGSVQANGETLRRVVNGFGDPAFRLSVNLYGAPALSLAEFASYRQDLIVGASLQVSAPLSQYDSSRLVNIGTNRWSFKPEVGVSKAIGAWTFESQLAATLFTDNDDFYGGRHRAQAPIYQLQGHAIYAFDSGVWTSLDATCFAGAAFGAGPERHGAPARR